MHLCLYPGVYGVSRCVPVCIVICTGVCNAKVYLVVYRCSQVGIHVQSGVIDVFRCVRYFHVFALKLFCVYLVNLVIF